MTDAPPINGADPSDILGWLVAQVAELRAENHRIRSLLALHGVDPDCEIVAQINARIEAEASIRYADATVLRAMIGGLQAQVACR